VLLWIAPETFTLQTPTALESEKYQGESSRPLPGGATDADNISATSAFLYAPKGVAVDSVGNIYIADTIHNRIRKVSGGIITTVAGNGTTGYSGDGGSATSADLHSPYGVALDSSGNLYIADYYNFVIRKVSGGIVTTVAGTGSYRYNGVTLAPPPLRSAPIELLYRHGGSECRHCARRH
jgi:sugar lactone lactonase YvrE